MPVPPEEKSLSLKGLSPKTGCCFHWQDEKPGKFVGNRQHRPGGERYPADFSDDHLVAELRQICVLIAESAAASRQFAAVSTARRRHIKIERAQQAPAGITYFMPVATLDQEQAAG